MFIYKVLYKENKFLLTAALALSLLSAVFGVGLLDLINNFVTDSSSITKEKLFVVFIMVFLLFFLVTYSQYLFNLVGNKVVYKLRLGISRRLLNTELETIHQIGKSKIMAVFANDIDEISGAFMSLPFVVFGIFIVSIAMFYLAWLSLPFFSILLVTLLISIAIAYKLISKTHYFLNLSRHADDKVYKEFQAIVEGQNELKLNLHRRSSFEAKDLEPSIKSEKEYADKGARFISLLEGWGDAATLILIASVIAVYFFFDVGDATQLASFSITILFIRSPLSNVMTSIEDLVFGHIAIKKIESLGLSGSMAEESIPEIDIEQWDSLSMTNVEYQYPNSGGELGFTLGPINFHIKKGDLIFIVGGNGSGKSTFAHLLSGLYKPSSGNIMLDAKVINKNNIKQYRHHFSVILADFFLFQRFIDHQGKVPTIDKVNNYIKLFGLEEKIKIKDELLNTIMLSQGQKKRLALISTYLEDKSILILDEWAADQDPSFRKVFYEEILPDLQKKGKTIIAITHDDSYFHIADRVLKLNNGNLESYDNQLVINPKHKLKGYTYATA